jgi:hypothetical protein
MAQSLLLFQLDLPPMPLESQLTGDTNLPTTLLKTIFPRERRRRKKRKKKCHRSPLCQQLVPKLSLTRKNQLSKEKTAIVMEHSLICELTAQTQLLSSPRN